MEDVKYIIVRVLVFFRSTTMSTLFDGVELSPPVEVYALNAAFNDDTDSHKVNLSIGGRPNYGFVNFAAFAVSMTLNLA